MFRFADPQYLWLLLAVPLLALLCAGALMLRRRSLQRYGDERLVRRLFVRFSPVRPLVKMGLLLLAVAALVLMLARPQYGLGETTETRAGIEAVIMLDVSNSMLAQDVSPSRLERSKLLVSNLIDRMTSDKVALGVFAGEAYPQLPITSDYLSAKMFLDAISTDMVTSQGTNLAAAIELASTSFTTSTEAGKAIILITDGEDHEGGALEAAREATAKGLKLFVLGVGEETGAPIPVSGGYLQDDQGQVVTTRLNETMCRELAEAAGGVYLHIDHTNYAQQQLQSALGQLQKAPSAETYAAYAEQFQAVGLIVLLLLLLEMLIFSGKNPLLSRIHPFRKRTFALTSLLFLCCTLPAQNAAHRAVHRGNRAFKAQRYDDAERHYLEAVRQKPKDARTYFNLGDAYLAKENGAEAMKQFEAAARSQAQPEVRAQAHYNMGVVSQAAATQAKPDEQQRLLREAIAHYKDALRLNPADDNARYNLVLCQKQLRDAPQQQSPQSDTSDSQQPDNQRQPDNQPQSEQTQQQKEQAMQQTQQLLNLARQAERQAKERVNAAQPKRRTRKNNW